MTPAVVYKRIDSPDFFDIAGKAHVWYSARVSLLPAGMTTAVHAERRQNNGVPRAAMVCVGAGFIVKKGQEMEWEGRITHART